jgi:hypothetical protein
MQVSMIGLGRMVANMVRRLIHKGHSSLVCNRSPQAVRQDGPQRNGIRNYGGIRGGSRYSASANVGKQANSAADAETLPLHDPEHYHYHLNCETSRRFGVVEV